MKNIFFKVCSLFTIIEILLLNNNVEKPIYSLQNNDIAKSTICVSSKYKISNTSFSTEYEFIDYLPFEKYWQDFSYEYFNNWNDIDLWNWGHYLTIISITILILSIISKVLKKAKK